MKPPTPESSTPPYPSYAPFPGYSQPPRKPHRWVWITLGILALACILGAALLAWGAGWAFTQVAQQQDAVAGKVSRFGMTTIPTGDPAYITLTVTRMNGTSYNVHLELRQEGGVWKVSAFDRI
jgi:hypothetical protein